MGPVVGLLGRGPGRGYGREQASIERGDGYGGAGTQRGRDQVRCRHKDEEGEEDEADKDENRGVKGCGTEEEEGTWGGEEIQ